jgi:hypothetical protein
MIQIIKNKIFIKDINKLICKNNIHFHHESKEILFPSKCKKFREINLVSGEIEYLYENICKQFNYSINRLINEKN